MVRKTKREKRQVREFSEELKKKIVKDIEQNKASIAAVCREYAVSSRSVYNWLNKHSRHLQKGIKLVLEMESENYRSKELSKKVAELERIVGQKQMQIDFLDKMIEIAGEESGIDIKKNYDAVRSTGIANTKGTTLTK